MPSKLPPNWTFCYLVIGVFGSSKQYLVLRANQPMFEISVDRPQKGAHIPIEKHLEYIWYRELRDFEWGLNSVCG